jgi:hypothetical protein
LPTQKPSISKQIGEYLITIFMMNLWRWLCGAAEADEFIERAERDALATLVAQPLVLFGETAGAIGLSAPGCCVNSQRISTAMFGVSFGMSFACVELVRERLAAMRAAGRG